MDKNVWNWIAKEMNFLFVNVIILIILGFLRSASLFEQGATSFLRSESLFQQCATLSWASYAAQVCFSEVPRLYAAQVCFSNVPRPYAAQVCFSNAPRPLQRPQTAQNCGSYSFNARIIILTEINCSHQYLSVDEVCLRGYLEN